MGGNVVSRDNDFNASFAGPRRDPSAARNLVLETRAVIHAYQVDIGLRSLTKLGQLDTKKKSVSWIWDHRAWKESAVESGRR
jgi:hypothetical protein